MASIEWLTKRLPPIERIRLRSEPDYYGISHLIAKELGYRVVPRSFAQWQHGWIYTDPITHPNELTIWGQPHETILVATQEQAEQLKQYGFRKAVAVGLPFIYSPSVQVPRKSNSLLVMPGHSSSLSSLSYDQAGYVEQLVQLKSHFREIVACVHSSCLVRGYWIKEFEKYNIPWIVGASVFDRNALRRMQIIFNSFDYMTTNVIGSHIPYAAYSGCNVSLWGKYMNCQLEDFQADPWYQKYPELLLKHIEMANEENIRARFPDFFTHPTQASEQRVWAAEILGILNRKSSAELSFLLGWNVTSQILGYFNLYQVRLGHLLRNPLRSIATKLKNRDGFEIDQIQKKFKKK